MEIGNSFNLGFLPYKLRKRLMPFQRDGIRYAIEKNACCLIADEMGLGKTLQALSVAYYYREKWPLLIVVPASLKHPWVEEIEKWFPEISPTTINMINTGVGFRDIASSQVTILSYGLLNRPSCKMVQEALKNQRFKFIIVDESHNMKNRKTNTSKFLVPLVQKAEHKILLTGTPALSKPIELFPQLDALRPGLFGNFYEFSKRYCDGKHEWMGGMKRWRSDGASNLMELQETMTRELMIRRLKKDVLTQLPPKRRQKIPFVLKESELKKGLERIQNELGAELSKLHSSISEVLREESEIVNTGNLFRVKNLMSEMYRETAKVKVGPVKDYVKMLSDNSGLKFLIFAYHHNMMDGISEELGDNEIKHIRIDGKTPSQERPMLVQQFQQDEQTRVAILSIKAAGVGLTLTAAKVVVFAELDWTPGSLEQCEDRAHRIGQEDTVHIHYLVAKGTLDEYVWSKLARKTTIVTTTLNGVAQKLQVEKADKAKIDKLSSADVYLPSEKTNDSSLLHILNSSQSRGQKSLLDFFSPRGSNQDLSKKVPKRSSKRGAQNALSQVTDPDAVIMEDSPVKCSKKRKKDTMITEISLIDDDGNSSDEFGTPAKSFKIAPQSDCDLSEILPDCSKNLTHIEKNVDTDGGKWSCSGCTYLNHEILPYCEICNSAKPQTTSVIVDKTMVRRQCAVKKSEDSNLDYSPNSGEKGFTQLLRIDNEHEISVLNTEEICDDKIVPNSSGCSSLHKRVGAHKVSDAYNISNVHAIGQCEQPFKQNVEYDLMSHKKDFTQMRRQGKAHEMSESDSEEIDDNKEVSKSSEKGGCPSFHKSTGAHKLSNAHNVSNVHEMSDSDVEESDSEIDAQQTIEISDSETLSCDEGLTPMDIGNKSVLNSSIESIDSTEVCLNKPASQSKDSCLIEEFTDTDGDEKIMQKSDAGKVMQKSGVKFQSRSGKVTHLLVMDKTVICPKPSENDTENDCTLRNKSASQKASDHCETDTPECTPEKTSFTFHRDMTVTPPQTEADIVKQESMAAQRLFSPGFRKASRLVRRGSWTCVQCDLHNDAEAEDCDGCLAERPAESVKNYTKISENTPIEATLEDEPHRVNVDELKVYPFFHYMCSLNTDRIYLYDQKEKPLNVNFLPIDVQMDCQSELPDVLLHPENLTVIKRFIREWNSMSSTKRRLIVKSEAVFSNPVLFYQSLTSKRKTSKERYTSRSTVALSSINKAIEIGGSVRVITRPTHEGMGGRGKKRKKGENETEQNEESSSIENYDKLLNTVKGVVQAVDKEGNPLCIHCQKTYENELISERSVRENPWYTRFCSRRCMDEYWMKHHQGYSRQQVFEAEKGVCQKCHFNCQNLFERIRVTKDLQKRAKLIQESPFKSLKSEMKEKMVKKPQIGQFWQADHIIPVAHGGGECDIDNLRTLCTVCHQKATAEQSRNKAATKRLEAANYNRDIKSFFQPSGV